MDILNRVLTLIEQKQMQDKDLYSNLNISASTFSSWKSRKTDPPAKYIVPMAKILGVPTHYLLTGEDEKDIEVTPWISLTNEETHLLQAFNTLNEKNKWRLIGNAEAWGDMQKEETNSKQTLSTYQNTKQTSKNKIS